MTNASGMQGWCATFLCGVALALLLLGGCAGDDDTPRGRYTEPCSSAVENPCEDGLSCILNQCTQSCATTEECRMNLGSDNAYCQGGTCFELCSPTKPCENGLTCTMAGEMNGTCRP
jgi:hypothetical protein